MKLRYGKMSSRTAISSTTKKERSSSNSYSYSWSYSWKPFAKLSTTLQVGLEVLNLFRPERPTYHSLGQSVSRGLGIQLRSILSPERAASISIHKCRPYRTLIYFNPLFLGLRLRFDLGYIMPAFQALRGSKINN